MVRAVDFQTECDELPRNAPSLSRPNCQHSHGLSSQFTLANNQLTLSLAACPASRVLLLAITGPPAARKWGGKREWTLCRPTAQLVLLVKGVHFRILARR